MRAVPMQPPHGYTRVSAAALEDTARLAAARLFAVPQRAVKVSIHDDGGALGLVLRLPMRARPLHLVGATDTEPSQPQSEPLAQGIRIVAGEASAPDTFKPLLTQANAATAKLGAQVGELTGRTVGRVDIRVTGVHTEPDRRVK